MSDPITIDNFPLSFLMKEGDESDIFFDINEDKFRNEIKEQMNKLKSLRLEISEKHSIRCSLEEKLRLLQEEENVTQNNIKYMMNSNESKLYEKETANCKTSLIHIKRQIKNSTAKIKLLIEKEFRVRKDLQLIYMTLYELLKERRNYIINDYVKLRKCSCLIYNCQKERKQI